MLDVAFILGLVEGFLENTQTVEMRSGTRNLLHSFDLPELVLVGLGVGVFSDGFNESIEGLVHNVFNSPEVAVSCFATNSDLSGCFYY